MVILVSNCYAVASTCFLAESFYPGLRGQLVLEEGEALFARDIDAHGDPYEDILQMFVGTRYVLPHVKRLYLLTDGCGQW